MLYTDHIDQQRVCEKKGILEQVTAIANDLYHARNNVTANGLLSGNAGITLFFAYLAKIYPDSIYEDITGEYLDRLSNALAEERLSPDMSAGIAGIAFVFQHLRNIDLLDSTEDLNLSAVDEAVSFAAGHYVKTGNWDPLHGLTGLGIYFVERYRETGEKKYLEGIVDQLSALSAVEKDNRVWITPAYQQVSKGNYNFGMAHGMPGLLSFLVRVYDLDIRTAVITEMIHSCLSFLLSNRSEEQEWYSFPASIEFAPDHEAGSRIAHPSRNAWCYGDLGMAGTLIHCGRSLGREDWYRLGIDIALQTTHIPFEYSSCADASFCHGSLGLVHQYRRLYQATRHPTFREAAGQWMDITRVRYYHPGRYAGGYAYRYYDSTLKKTELISSYGLLEGIAGIGLVLLSCLHDFDPDWDIIFQTKI